MRVLFAPGLVPNNKSRCLSRVVPQR
uniref:Uncharacterized protein n=1 Tax=Arundo donax TaxID=35708 RepID=A0A0A9C3E7_ARUDO